jgi:hypothetical protein
MLSGCYRPSWHRANTTYAQLRSDSDWCKSQTTIGSTRSEAIEQYEKCMRNKGYQLKDKGDPYTGGELSGWNGRKAHQLKLIKPLKFLYYSFILEYNYCNNDYSNYCSLCIITCTFYHQFLWIFFSYYAYSGKSQNNLT